MIADKYFCDKNKEVLMQQTKTERIGEMVKGLMRAIQQHDMKQVEWLVFRGANLNGHYDIHRSTPFMYAMTVFHKAEEIEKLISLGGDVNYKNRRGETALMIAVENHCADIVPWVMVDYGAELDVQDVYGNTALMRCLMSQNPSKKLVYALIDYGADLTNLKNNEGLCAFDMLWRGNKWKK